MPRRSKLINIIIADASARIRKELAGLFSKLDGVKVVAQAGDTEQTLKLTRKHFSGNDLYSDCNSSEVIDRVTCLGYIQG